tara:strand:+ start:103 stop:468 length:366 start_codon:yes stop_codon:yes gene_type:complete
MAEIVELRNKPELKIILSTDGFEIIDISEPKNTGEYTFEEIKNVELTAERTDKLITTLSWILAFFTGGGTTGENYKNRANLKLGMVNQNLKIWLVDADFQKAERIAHILTEKKPTHNNTYN